MSGSNLPPVRHLPHWTRVGRLGKPCSPRRLPANRLPVVPPADGGVGTPAAEVSRHGDVEPRVVSMQRNIQFLQQQHKDTLEKLHAETEYLRRENKGEECHSCSCFSPVMCVYRFFVHPKIWIIISLQYLLTTRFFQLCRVSNKIMRICRNDVK